MFHNSAAERESFSCKNDRILIFYQFFEKPHKWWERRSIRNSLSQTFFGAKIKFEFLGEKSSGLDWITTLERALVTNSLSFPWRHPKVNFRTFSFFGSLQNKFFILKQNWSFCSSPNESNRSGHLLVEVIWRRILMRRRERVPDWQCWTQGPRSEKELCPGFLRELVEL